MTTLRTRGQAAPERPGHSRAQPESPGRFALSRAEPLALAETRAVPPAEHRPRAHRPACPAATTKLRRSLPVCQRRRPADSQPPGGTCLREHDARDARHPEPFRPARAAPVDRRAPVRAPPVRPAAHRGPPAATRRTGSEPAHAPRARAPAALRALTRRAGRAARRVGIPVLRSRAGFPLPVRPSSPGQAAPPACQRPRGVPARARTQGTDRRIPSSRPVRATNPLSVPHAAARLPVGAYVKKNVLGATELLCG